MATGTIVFLLLIFGFYCFSGYLLMWSVKSAAKRNAEEANEATETADTH